MQADLVMRWEFLKPLVQQLCAALEYAHGEKVVHRDLKPANVMVDGRGRLKLADFGIAATVSDSVSRISLRHATSGTLPYMSPQQLAGKHPSVADDIYALGATLYELLSSKPPFYTGDLTHQVLHEAPEPLEARLTALEIQNEVPPDVAAIIMACLAKDPTQRPQNARAVAEWVGLEVVSRPSLQNLSNEMFGLASPEEPDGLSQAGDATAPPSRSQRNVLLAGVAVAALILIGLGGWYWKLHPSTRGGSQAQGQSENTEPNSSIASIAAISEAAQSTAPDPAVTEPGFVNMFNGRDFTGWKGDTTCWSVKDGVLDVRLDGSKGQPNASFLKWTNGEARDFELRLRCCFVGIVQPTRGKLQIWFRNTDPPDRIQRYKPYFAEVNSNPSTHGAIFAPLLGPKTSYPMLAQPGQRRTLRPGDSRQVQPILERASSPSAVHNSFKQEDWNDVVILADGPHTTVTVNGILTSELIDDDAENRPSGGYFSLGVYRDLGEFVHMQFKDMRLKRLGDSNSPGAPENADTSKWLPLFDGKTLSGWTAPEGGDWRVDSEGCLTARGDHSHLFSPNAYRNVEWSWNNGIRALELLFAT